MFVQIISVVFVLGIIVIIHEFGHYISARSLGIAVQEFAVGMGPALWKKQGKTTLYSVRCIPFGGYCLFDPHIEGDDSRGRPLSLVKRKALTKIYVHLAGPFMNFVLAAALFTVLFSFIGVAEDMAVIGAVEPDSPAAAAGILPGDRILSIAGEEVAVWQDLLRIMRAYRGEGEVEFLVQRATETHTLLVTPRYVPEEDRSIIGVLVDQNYMIIQKISPLEAIRLGLRQTIMMIGILINAITQLVTGKINVAEELSGPVGLALVIAETASTGLTDTFFLIAFLSVNLGLMNLLPVPALDGGKTIMYTIELIRRKPLKHEIEGWLNAAGFAFVILLVVYLTFNDIVRIIGRQ